MKTFDQLAPDEQEKALNHYKEEIVMAWMWGYGLSVPNNGFNFGLTMAERFTANNIIREASDDTRAKMKLQQEFGDYIDAYAENRAKVTLYAEPSDGPVLTHITSGWPHPED